MPSAKALTARRSFMCRICGRRVPMPKGWTVGPAVRRHYWAKHPHRMRRAGAGR